MKEIFSRLALCGLLGILPGTLAETEAAEAQFKSDVVTSRTSGHAVEVDVDLSGAKELYLVVTDGGNGIACDWADWIEPRLIGPKGETVHKLTELEWEKAEAGWGKVRINRNADGGPLMVAGGRVKYGIGTHANSVIKFDVPEDYTRFKARAGLDNGGTNQSGGNGTSVRFWVFTEKPPAALTRRSSGGQSGGRAPEEALAGLDVHDDLQADLFAAEPMLRSPANIDIDHKGRLWVCEIVNYRPFRGDQGGREEGDRILVLEDTDQDGKADEKTVFYQGTDINSPHGVCVLPEPNGKTIRVIVSTATKKPGPHVTLFTDVDGDLKADEKTPLFTGISGGQHDHSIHALTFGPDGRFYFNMGNAGRQIKDAEGNIVVDRAGNEVRTNGRPYRQGLVFRCDLDLAEGSLANFETLGWNFRNNWMVTPDSFATMWQSDNDDDGNRGVRINYVMPFGNYGYRDEITGAGWRASRTGMAEDVPSRHWHQNDPGVVPNLLQTGAGSPTGITVYEGDLLPKVFQNEMIHCDAGPRVVRAYPVEKDGAGYKAETVNLLSGTRDKWFRPADVSVAPDGSLLVADWYDPGVGGHRARSLETGRIFRITPAGHSGKYRPPQFDFTSTEGLIEALKNPAYAVRSMAWTALHRRGEKAEPALQQLFEESENPRYQARALWLLSRLKDRGYQNAARALDYPNPDIRITALRAIKQMVPSMQSYVSGTAEESLQKLGPQGMLANCVEALLHDESPQVRRECAIALRGLDSPKSAELLSLEVPELWAELAVQHDGKDRWYLEALGIGAAGKWDACFAAWLERVGEEWNTPAGRDIVWRSRANETVHYLAKILTDPAIPREDLPRYLRAFHFQQSPEKQQVLEELAFGELPGDEDRRTFIATDVLDRLKGFAIEDRPQHQAALNRLLDELGPTSPFVSLVAKFRVQSRYPELLQLAQQKPASQLGVEAIRALLSRNQTELIRDALKAAELETAIKTVRALGNSADGKAMKLLLPIMNDQQQPLELRRQATRSLGNFQGGAQRLVQLAQNEKLDDELQGAAAAALHTASSKTIRQQAQKLFPLPATKNKKPLPPIAQLVKMKGDVAQGKEVFHKKADCADCHKVNGQGKEVGPELSGIGQKLSRQAFFESIIYPSAGISHNYETYAVALKSGNVVNGILVSETPDAVTIKDEKAITRTFSKSDILEMKKQDVSLMPADLQKTMTTSDLVNVVEYLTTLKQAKK